MIPTVATHTELQATLQNVTTFAAPTPMLTSHSNVSLIEATNQAPPLCEEQMQDQAASY